MKRLTLDNIWKATVYSCRGAWVLIGGFIVLSYATTHLAVHWTNVVALLFALAVILADTVWLSGSEVGK